MEFKCSRQVLNFITILPLKNKNVHVRRVLNSNTNVSFIDIIINYTIREVLVNYFHSVSVYS